MSLKKYLILMTIACILCWGGWSLVLFLVNPFSAGWIGIVLFYTALFLGLASLFSIVGFVVRFVIIKHEFAYKHVRTAFRQGLMFSLLVVGALFLQAEKLLVWWNLILMIVLLGVIEYAFIVKEGNKVDRV